MALEFLQAPWGQCSKINSSLGKSSLEASFVKFKELFKSAKMCCHISGDTILWHIDSIFTVAHPIDVSFQYTKSQL